MRYWRNNRKYCSALILTNGTIFSEHGQSLSGAREAKPYMSPVGSKSLVRNYIGNCQNSSCTPTWHWTEMVSGNKQRHQNSVAAAKHSSLSAARYRRYLFQNADKNVQLLFLKTPEEVNLCLNRTSEHRFSASGGFAHDLLTRGYVPHWSSAPRPPL